MYGIIIVALMCDIGQYIQVCTMYTGELFINYELLSECSE